MSWVDRLLYAMVEANSEFEKQVVMENLRKHVEYLSVGIGERHIWKEGSLNKAADYVESAMTGYGYSVWSQPISAMTRVCRIWLPKERNDKKIVIIGAIMTLFRNTGGR